MKILFIGLLMIASLSANTKMYVSEEDIEIGECAIWVHRGGNMWEEALAISSEEHGVYFVEQPKGQQVKKWKCPYCHMMWPIGKKCQNVDCPSKY